MFSQFLNDDIVRYGQQLTLTRVDPTHFDFPYFMENFVQSMINTAVKQVYGIVIWISGTMTVLFFVLDIPSVRTNFRKVPIWPVYGIEYLARKVNRS